MLSPTARRQPTRARQDFTHADRWTAALTDFTDTMGRARLAPSTLARISKHLRHFAAATGCAPYDATRDDVTGWLESLTCSTQARYAYRTSVRTFYRWAHRAGRVPDDPSRDDGPHPLARPIPQHWSDVLADFARWLRAASYSPETLKVYRHRLAALARETGAPTPWTLTADDLSDWMARHQWSRETLRATRTILRTFYRWAHERGDLDHNPAQQLPRIRATAPAPRPAAEAAYRSALAAADDRTALMLRLAADLGLRRAEVAQVHAADLTHDEHTDTWWLLVHGKGDKPRRLPIPRDLAAQIRRRGPGYAFPGNRHGHLSPQRVGTLVAQLLPEGVTMHALRHRFATRAYNIDRDVFTVQQLLGHARADTTQRYVQTDGTAMRRLVDLVAR